jgi:uncharacterized membrane protein YfcA
MPEVSRWILFILASLSIGFITGFLGVGGGFMIVPVLVLVFQLPMKVAAGTSLVVISLNCAVGIAASTSRAISSPMTQARCCEGASSKSPSMLTPL